MKKVNQLLASIFLLGALSCSNDEQLLLDQSTEILTIEEIAQSTKFLSIDEINKIIDQSFYDKQSFSWDDVPANVLWSASVHGGQMITVGYGDEGESFHQEKSSRITDMQNDIISIVQSGENKSRSSLKVKTDEILNVIDIEVNELATIQELRATSNIRYLEPNGYSFYELSAPKGAQQVSKQQTRDAGCDTSGNTINSNDYRTISPGAQLPWTYDYHNIEAAWNQSTGQGVTIGIIDTGLSPNQPLLGSNFGDGTSINNRTVEKYGTYIDSNWWWASGTDGPNDQCGHGTSMAAAALAPRNNDGLPVGVAYNANLVMYRGTSDVLLNDYHERKGVSDALKALANRNDVNIISMSIGYTWSIGNVRDAVEYAYSRGKLIFAAGGTSSSLTNWYPVIFPASMSETVAVTGITDGSGYTQCDICHDGSQIEFTMVMQRDGDDSRTSPTLGFNNGQARYTGGSSVATATTAGVAALVWSKYPNWSREQVLNRMRSTADLSGNTSSNYGYGNVNANLAVQ